jgi:ATP-dependent Lon protease
MIDLNNGWRITLGRGLDIFEKYERFSRARNRQEDRRCKECTITFIEQNK